MHKINLISIGVINSHITYSLYIYVLININKYYIINIKIKLLRSFYLNYIITKINKTLKIPKKSCETTDNLPQVFVLCYDVVVDIQGVWES